MELWKLALYPDHKSAAITQAVNNKLKRLNKSSVEDLIKDHLKAIKPELEAKITEALPFHYTGALDTLTMEVFLSVPQMWTVESNKVMIDAARAAGFQRVELVFEPHCAMGCFGALVQLRLPDVLQAGDIVHVADAGGGTADFVSYRVDVSNGYGANMVLNVAQAPKGRQYKPLANSVY